MLLLLINSTTMVLPIKDYPNYFISNKGIVYNKVGLALLWHYSKKPTRSGHKPNTHPRVTLYKNNKAKQFFIHRLVAIH